MVSKYNSLDESTIDTGTRSILIALAHISGWSAERISGKVKEKLNLAILPEHIYKLHQYYVSITTDEGIKKDKTQMKIFLESKGFLLLKTGRPMSELLGKAPVTVRFARKWNAKLLNNSKLCPHYDNLTRINTINYLLSFPDPLKKLSVLAPMEVAAVEQLGPYVSATIKYVLALYVGYLLQYIEHGIEEWKSIKWQMHSDSVSTAMRIFRGHWENHYGMMAEFPATLPEHFHDGVISIKSTGQGANILLGLILSNRATVADKSRDWARLDTGFKEVAIEELPNDSRDCSICRDPLGVENEEGYEESAIRLIFCCGQIIGRRCLKNWLDPAERQTSCPTCRAKFSTSFINKLRGKEDGGAEVNGHADGKGEEDGDGGEGSETDANMSDGGDFGSESQVESEEEG